MNERNRRQFLTLLALGLAGCAAPQSTTSRDQDTNQPSQRTQSASPEKTAQPTLEQRVKTIGLAVWKDLLTKKQESDRSARYLSMNVTNPGVLEEAFRQILLSSAKPTEIPIKAAWVALSTGSNDRGYGGQKWIGEVELNNISIQTFGSVPQGAADRANGLEWAGGVILKFIERGHSSLERTAFGSAVEKSVYDRWATSTIPREGFPQFSPWQNSEWGFLLTIQNGQLKRDASKRAYGGILEGFELPTTVFESCSPELGCKTVTADLK